MRLAWLVATALAIATPAQAQISVPALEGARAVPTSRPAPAWTRLRETARAPRPDETGTVRVGDAEIYYASYGRGRPIVLLHGGLGNGDYWDSQIGPLSQSHEVITIDLRGHGRSTRGAEPFTYSLLANDVMQVIHKLHLADPTVIGWGDGGVIALELAMRHPNRVGRLVLFSANYTAAGLKQGVDKTQTFIDYVHKTAADYQTLSKTPGEYDALFRALEAMWESGPAYTAAQLGEIKVPTTVIIAEHDEWVRRDHAEDMANLIPRAQLVVLPDVSHFAAWQRPSAFNEVISLAIDDRAQAPKKRGLLELMRD